MATTTVYLPLTTSFSAPPECSSLFVIPGVGENRAMYAFDPGHPLKDPTAPECVPEQVLSWWQQDAATTATEIGGSTMICPDEYTTAASINEGTRTLIGCCPSAYTFIQWFGAAAPGQCKSTLKPGLVKFIATGSDGLYSKSTSLVITSSAIFGVQINGYITAGTDSSTSSSTRSSTATGSPTTTSTSTPSATAPPTNEPSGLSTGAKAGIGAGAGAIAILALVGAFLWYRRRHRYKAVELPAGGDPPPGGYYVPTEKKKETNTQELSAAGRPAELA